MNETTVEYMSHALFVIGTNTGGTPELLQQGKFGFLIHPNNPKELAEAIVNYRKNRADCQSKSVLSRTYAENIFSVQKNAEQAFFLYKQFMK